MIIILDGFGYSTLWFCALRIIFHIFMFFHPTRSQA